MKVIKVTSVPNCDICGAKAAGIYDGPIAGMGSSWANMCVDCGKMRMDVIEKIGCKREVKCEVPKSEDTEVYEANDVADPRDIILGDSARVLECPKCGETRDVEPDFHGEYQCSGCGRRIQACSLC